LFKSVLTVVVLTSLAVAAFAAESETFTGTAARTGTYKRPLLIVDGKRHELKASDKADANVADRYLKDYLVKMDNFDASHADDVYLSPEYLPLLESSLQRLQRLQREAGNSFVSRTTLHRSGRPDTVVLRAVIMNPRTTPQILRSILDEQESLYRELIAPSLPL
jgi:glutamate decarboxylase